MTQEETPDSMGQFIKQRTRWSLGFMQVMAKGEWKKLPTFWERARAVMLLDSSTPWPSPAWCCRWPCSLR